MKIDEDPAPVGMHGTARCRIEKLQFRAVREAEMPRHAEVVAAPHALPSTRVTCAVLCWRRSWMLLGPRVLYMVVFCSRHALPISKPHTICTIWSSGDPEIHTTRSSSWRIIHIATCVVVDVSLSLSVRGKQAS